MSQGRSPSGVASLRARFEQNKQENDTSPPSRGRSPAASLTNEEPRPLSKIRTNFVAVEPSRNMSSNLEVPNADPATSHGNEELKEGARKNDVPELGPSSSAPTKPGLGLNEKLRNNDVTGNHAEAGDRQSSSRGQWSAAVGEESEGLGSILKGSPFEDESTGRKDDGVDSEQGLAKIGKPKSTGASSIRGEGAVKGGVTKQLPQRGSLPSKTDQLSTKVRPSQNIPPATKAISLTNGASKGEKQPASIDHSTKKASDSEVSQKQPPADHSRARQAVPAPVKSPEMVTAPPRANGATKTHGSIHAPSKNNQTVPAPKPKRTDRDTKPVRPNGQLADHAASKDARNPAPPVREGPNQSRSELKPSTKPIPSSTGFIKPRPKSPTKPVKLPSSATAPTASSTAKHDGEEAGPQPRSNRQSDAMPKPKTGSDSSQKPVRSVRSSLPANSRPVDKAKPKGRSSLAPSTTSSSGFLERMMRPTQSSAQKVHEKFETNSPPRRNTQSGRHSSKSKRKSGESASVKSENGDAQSPSISAAQPVDGDDAKPIEALPLTEETPEIANEA